MVKIRQAGQGRWVSLVSWGCFGLAATLTPGCSSTPVTNGAAADPLFGVMVPPGMPQPTNTPKADAVPPAPTQGFNQLNPSGVQATPASLSSGNPATLAGANWQGPLGRPTPIGDNNSFGPPFLPGQSTLGSKTQQVPGSPGLIAPNPNPKVELVPDLTPITPPVTPTSSWQTPQPSAPPVQTASLAQPASGATLAKQLQDRGVLSQKQDAVAEGVRLTCYLSRGPEGGLRVLEVTAADYPAAAQAILQQLDAGR